MILVDLNQVLISNLMVQTRGKAEVKPNMEMVRSMVLNSLRGFNLKFRDEYGKMVLCSDASNPWRRAQNSKPPLVCSRLSNFEIRYMPP